MLKATHHIAVLCSDYERSKEFYVNKLGFTVFEEVWRENFQDWIRMLRKGDIVLELFTSPTAPQRLNDPEALGLRHIAFQVEDVDAAVAWLASMGIESENARLSPVDGRKMTFFRDPDGLPLELHED